MRWEKGQSGNPGQVWRTGQSGNPRGRPKRGAALAERLRWQLQQVTGEDGKATRADEVVNVLIAKALEGDTTALRTIFERVDGPVAPVPQPETGWPVPFTVKLAWPNEGLPAPPSD